MKKEEFLEYIKTFNKNAGEYTQDELYQIGLKHKELDVSDRNWNELVSLLGVKNEKGELKTGETFRCWIKAQQIADGSLPKNIKMLSGRTIEDATPEEIDKNIEEQKRALYIQETKTRDERTEYRRTLRDEARIDKIKQLIAESIVELKDLPNINYKNSYYPGDTEAVMLISDMHIGMQIDNYANKYNNDIAQKRLMSYVDETIRACQLNKVKRLNVCNLSDAIHGIIHISCRVGQQEDVISQVMYASELLANALNKLQEAAPEIVYRSVTDNHARIVPDLSQHIEKENFSRLIDFYLESRLKGTNIIFAADNLDYDISLFKLLNGKTMICSHGHRDNINSVLQNYCGATRQYIDYVCLGHYHETKMKSFQGAKVFVNGSLCGPDDYACSKRLFGDPEQTLLIFNNNVLIQHVINLKDVR